MTTTENYKWYGGYNDEVCVYGPCDTKPDLPREAYDRFIDSPCEFLMTADDATLTRIWDAVQARQPARYKA